MSEAPRHWRLKDERLRFATRVLLESNDYKIVEGFGNSLWVISKIGEENFMLTGGINEVRLYPNRDGHNKEEEPLKTGIIYQNPLEEKVNI